MSGRPEASVISDFVTDAAGRIDFELTRMDRKTLSIHIGDEGQVIVRAPRFVTREQIAAMLYRTAGSPAVTGSLTEFPDGTAVSSWAADAMTWAVSLGLFQGDGAGQLNPSGEATRMEVAVILMRFCQQQNA